MRPALPPAYGSGCRRSIIASGRLQDDDKPLMRYNAMRFAGVAGHVPGGDIDTAIATAVEAAKPEEGRCQTSM
jgi:hypothetical protein